MNLPKISIVIPSYNKVKYIGKTLDSIFNQNYKGLEVIIQDGGSTDGTVGVVNEYIKRFPNIIKFESKKDKGQLDAINTGLKKATGDIVTFINADDVYDSDCFEAVSGYFQENPDSLWFVGKGVVINEDDNEIAKFASAYKNFLLSHITYYLLLITNFLMQPSVFLTKKAYKKYGPFTGTSDFVMEYDLWLKLSRVKMPTIINKNLSKFRIERDTKTKNLARRILNEDYRIVKRYTKNSLILLLHLLHNNLRLLINKHI